MASVHKLMVTLLTLLAFTAFNAAPAAAVAFVAGKAQKQVNSAGSAREQRSGADRSFLHKELHADGAEESESLWTAENALLMLNGSVLKPVVTLDDYGRKPGSPNAVVTLICNDRWVPGALALAASLRKTGLKADSVLMLGNEVSKHYHHVLKANFDHVYEQEALKSHPSIRRANADCLTLQLRTWELPYKKALFMDADMIVLKNPDRLFLEYGELTAKMEKAGGDFNGGMFMCEPSATTFDKLRAGLSLYQGTKGRTGMQQFLNHMYPDCRSAEPITQVLAGCMQHTFGREHNKFSRDLEPEEAAAMVQGNSKYDSVHFSGDWETEKKPWMKGCMMNASSTTKFDGTTRDNVLNLWMQAFESATPPTGGEHQKPEVECPFFNCRTARGTMDFVVHSDKLDCVTQSAIASVLKYAAPRRVLLVAPEKVCRQCFMSEVQCVDRDSLAPSISKQGIKAWIRAKHGNKLSKDAREALARKFFDQFLRVGLVDASAQLSLSDEFVLFDSEFLLIRDFCPYNKAGQVTFMEGDEERDFTCQLHHAAVFKNLTGEPFAFSKNRRSFNAYHMVMSKKIMNELLRRIEELHPSEDHWSIAMLQHMCASPEDCACGFPDLGSYASWMRSRHPEKFVESGQLYRLWHPAPWQLRAKREKACCPEVYDFTTGNLELGMGHQFVRWDRNCRPINGKMLTKAGPKYNMTKKQRLQAQAEARWFDMQLEGKTRSGHGSNSPPPMGLPGGPGAQSPPGPAASAQSNFVAMPPPPDAIPPEFKGTVPAARKLKKTRKKDSASKMVRREIAKKHAAERAKKDAASSDKFAGDP